MIAELFDSLVYADRVLLFISIICAAGLVTWLLLFLFDRRGK